MGRNKKTRWILIAVAAGCLLVVLFGLLTCGGGTLSVNEMAHGFPGYSNQEDYEVYMGLRIHCVTAVAATIWGVLLRCRIPYDYYTVNWYEKDSEEYEVTDTETTRWVFLRPGESLRFCIKETWSLHSGTFWTFTYFKD